jgi:hypothetical protein
MESFGRQMATLGVAALLVGAALGAGQTGVSGSVAVSPARPGPQRAGEPDSGAYAGASVQLRNARGAVVASTKTDDQGNFTLTARAGHYRIAVDTQGALYPRCEEVDAEVREGRMTAVRLSCDSGMR